MWYMTVVSCMIPCLIFTKKLTIHLRNLQSHLLIILLKDMVRDLRDIHKQDVKTQPNLMKSIDRLTNQVADLTNQNRTISERIAELAQTFPSRD